MIDNNSISIQYWNSVFNNIYKASMKSWKKYMTCVGKKEDDAWFNVQKI